MSRKKLLRDKKTFGGRFEQARIKKGLDIKDLAKIMGCSPSHITGIELNNKRPSEYFLNDLEQKTGIRKDFLQTGEGQSIKEKYCNQKEEEQHLGLEEVDSLLAHPDLGPIIEKLGESIVEAIKVFASELDKTGSRLDAIESMVRECREWRKDHKEAHKDIFPTKPAKHAG